MDDLRKTIEYKYYYDLLIKGNTSTSQEVDAKALAYTQLTYKFYNQGVDAYEQASLLKLRHQQE